MTHAAPMSATTLGRTLVPLHAASSGGVQWDLLQSCSAAMSPPASGASPSPSPAALSPPPPPPPPYPPAGLVSPVTPAPPMPQHPPPPPPPSIPPAPPAISIVVPSTPSQQAGAPLLPFASPAARARADATSARTTPPPLPPPSAIPTTPSSGDSNHSRHASRAQPPPLPNKQPPPLPLHISINPALAAATAAGDSMPRSASLLVPPTSARGKGPPPLPRSASLIDTSSSHASSAGLGGGGGVVSPLTPSSSGSAASMRRKIECEILSTEESYLASLQHFVSEFLQELRRRIRSGRKDEQVAGVDEEGVNRLAGSLCSIDTLAQFHAMFLAALRDEFTRVGALPSSSSSAASSRQQQQHSESTSPDIAGAFLKFSDYFKLYTAYLNGYEACVMQMEHWRDNDSFQRFVREFVAKPRRSVGSAGSKAATSGVLSPTPPSSSSAGGGLGPMDYIIQPVQRLPRYVLLLQQLLKHTPESEDRSSIATALAKIESVASYVNERKRGVELMQRQMELSDKLQDELPESIRLIEPHRKLLREGVLCVVSSRDLPSLAAGQSIKSSRCLFLLLNDLLLWFSDAGNGRFKGSLNLDGAGVIPSDQDECVLQVSDASRSVLVRAESWEEARAWNAALDAAIATLAADQQLTQRRKGAGGSNKSDLQSLFVDPQCQSEWLEKEAAAQRRREASERANKLRSASRSGSSSSSGSGSSTRESSPPRGMYLPRDLIAQLSSKLAQQAVLHASSSTCTTAAPSAAHSRNLSRRPSFSRSNSASGTSTPVTELTSLVHDRNSSSSSNGKRSVSRAEAEAD